MLVKGYTTYISSVKSQNIQLSVFSSVVPCQVQQLEGSMDLPLLNLYSCLNPMQNTPRLCLILIRNWFNQHQGYTVNITVYPKKYAHGFCFAVLCCGYTLTDFPISIRLTSLALWQSNDCPSASKATLMNMDEYFMWIHYERLRNHNKAKHNKTVCIFLGIYCSSM